MGNKQPKTQTDYRLLFCAVIAYARFAIRADVQVLREQQTEPYQQYGEGSSAAETWTDAEEVSGAASFAGGRLTGAKSDSEVS